MRARHVNLVLDDRLVFQHLAGEHEGVARRHRLDEILLDLAEQPAAARDHFGGTRAHETHLQHVGLHDGANIHAVHLRDARVRDTPTPVLHLPDLREALVGFERVAAGRDEIGGGVEVGAGKRRVGRGGRHLAIKIVGVERHAAGAAEHVLRQHVEPADAQRRRVLRIHRDGLNGRGAFQHLEAIGRHEHPFRGLIHAVIGAADALEQPRGAFRRADIDHQIDVAPVDAEIERGGRHHGAQLSRRHRILDAAALADIERAMMQRDREIIVVHPPQLLEDRTRPGCAC